MTMETELLERILSKLSDIHSDTHEYDYYDSKLVDLDNKLERLIKLMNDQASWLESIAENIGSMENFIPSSPNLDSINEKLNTISNRIDNSNSLLSDINMNTSR